MRKGGKKSKAKEKALKLLAEGKYGQARDLLSRVLEEDEKDPRLWLRLGDAERKLDRAEAAAEAYKRAAEGFSEAGFLVQAISCLKQVIDLVPDREDVHRELAEVYSRRGIRYEKEEESPRVYTVGTSGASETHGPTDLPGGTRRTSSSADDNTPSERVDEPDTGEPGEDDVVFYYDDHFYLFWYRDRVWQVRFDHRYQGAFLGVRMGTDMDEVIRSIGKPYRRVPEARSGNGGASPTERSEAERNEISLVFFLPDSSLTPAAVRGGFPLRLRAIFHAGRLVDLYLYRGDY